MKTCKVESCNNKYYSKGYCGKHYTQLRNHGKILKRTMHDPNEIIDCGEYCEICLYNRQNQEVARTKIDKEDLQKIKNYKLHFNTLGYCGTGSKGLLLHHLILDKKKGLDIDHINHDTLDNRKQNLRHCTRSQNMMNTKNVKGYCWYKITNKWLAYIKINNKSIHLGYFKNEKDAIKARREAEKKYFKEFTFKI